MSVAASHTPMPASSPLKKISWEDFERKYLNKEDRYKYEWVDGVVVKTLRTLNQSQQSIFLNLMHLLKTLQASNPSLGELLSEVETWFGTAYRRPDIAYFSKDQMQLFGKSNQEPQFIIEVISNSDQMHRANEKLIDYRSSNIPVVWHIFPKLKQVHVYRGKQMTICTDDDICSAEPVIPGFLIAASGVFK